MLLNGVLKGKAVFIGVGNALKRDDGVGPYISSLLTGALDAGTVPENFISKVNGLEPDTVLIFDALDFGGKPGEVRIIDASETTGINISTHAMPLSRFRELLNAKDVWLVGIQPKSIVLGQGLSNEVKSAAKSIAREISDLAGLAGKRFP